MKKLIWFLSKKMIIRTFASVVLLTLLGFVIGGSTLQSAYPILDASLVIAFTASSIMMLVGVFMRIRRPDKRKQYPVAARKAVWLIPLSILAVIGFGVNQLFIVSTQIQVKVLTVVLLSFFAAALVSFLQAAIKEDVSENTPH